ncbi:HAD family phosphatase [Aestuariivirga litoralis]|uniref:HAD family phosphatase n=1 Tax=Aestuariivirga litoralis TaxID=2650924 RepID=A0A2W2AJU6_9HYPH|nr:HAD family phosphatase [Aestuariivirga litoralis]PZF75591.1 HAD family phosphatase [Aestuariivirga litoralis]
MNVVFDIGNVLVHWEPRALYRKIFATEDEVEWFITHVCNSDWNIEQDRGRSFGEAVALLSRRFPEHAEAIAAYDLRWHETVLGPIEGTVAILAELQQRGVPLYAITNFNQDKFQETVTRFPFLSTFRDIVVSGDERLLKPDPAIYRVLLDRNGLAAPDCVFIDDSLKNVRGAEDVGMKAIHFTSPGELRRDLAALGVL